MYNEKQKELLKVFQKLDKTVNDAVHARTKWMDEHMADFSQFKIGDKVYSRDGEELGTVTKLYRYHAEQHDWHLDDSMDIQIEYQVLGMHNCYDNSSRQPFNCLTKHQVEERLSAKLKHFR